jgi:hypothetical protein
MVVRTDHDGVTWVRYGVVGAVGAVAAVAVLAFGASAALATWHLLAFAALTAATFVAGALAVRLVRGEELRVTVRALTADGLTVRLDDIATVQVLSDARSGRDALVVETRRGDRHVLAPGSLPQHLSWFLRRIDEARAVTAERERREGREWTFLRHAPEDLDKLREP